MSTEEVLKAYKEGFKDGYDQAIKTYLSGIKTTRPQDNAWSGCKVCGRSGLSGVVCSYPGCPNVAYSGAIGAAGSY